MNTQTMLIKILKELKKLIENFFDSEGFPINRNPNDLIKLSKYLILIKECGRYYF